MSCLDAAFAMLEARGRPLRVREIMLAADGSRLPQSAGKTLAATMAARLHVYVRDHPDGRLVRLSQASHAERAQHRAHRARARGWGRVALCLASS